MDRKLSAPKQRTEEHCLLEINVYKKIDVKLLQKKNLERWRLLHVLFKCAPEASFQVCIIAHYVCIFVLKRKPIHKE